MKTAEQQKAWDELLVLTAQNAGWDPESEVGKRITALRIIVEGKEIKPKKFKRQPKRLNEIERQEIYQLYMSGTTKSRLREIYRLSWAEITQALIETGAIDDLIKLKNEKLENEKDEIVKQYLDGIPFTEILNKYGKNKVYDVLRERKIKRLVPRGGKEYF